MSAARMLPVLAILPFVARPAIAELAPRFTVWQDFAAITRQSEIPRLFGIVDAIERVGTGRYIVRGGECSVAVRVLRAGTLGPNGLPIPGPSHIVRVEVGTKRCGS